MSKEFSKKKEKRSRSSSNEANNSFVKNVTARVSGLLPAAVARWFGSPSAVGANGSAPVADQTDSSTEDEGPEGVAQPPPKRMRFTSPAAYSHEENCIGDTIDLDPGSSFGAVQSPPGRTTFHRETNFVSTPLRPSDEAAETSKGGAMFKQHTVSSMGPTVATKRKSLFDSLSSAETSKIACAKTSCNTPRDPSLPCFKPSLLGSPFYAGRTTYGGASSSYINHANIKQRKNTLVNESSTSDNTVSLSTRRIMDLLENYYSSPLNEAKRIPQYTRTPRNHSLNTSSTSVSPPSNHTISYKTQELHVPSVASILRLKKKDRLMDTTSAARQLIASHSSTAANTPYPSATQHKEQTENETSSKLTTKVKTRLTRPKRGESSDAETELPTPVTLPTAVLQIDHNNLPKFAFSGPQPSARPAIARPTAEAARFTDTPLRKPDVVTSANPYKFSSPVRISGDEAEPKDTPPKFTFGSPDRSIDKVSEKKDDSFSVLGPTKTKEAESVAEVKDWQCSDCWVFNKQDVGKCVCCGGAKPSQTSKAPAKCIVCKLADSQQLSDKCVNCNKIKMNNISEPIAKPDDSSNWKCEDCWVSNESTKDVCVCCGASNSKKSVTVTKPEEASKWKCGDCWVNNDSSDDKCVCCGAKHPKNSVSVIKQNTTVNNKKTHVDKWECSSCLVRNDGDKTKCVCCETERQGTTKESDKKSFNFGMNTNTTFKFGIDPGVQSQVASATKPAEVKLTTTESKKEESETNNNILPKTPSFSFGLPAKKSDDQTDSAKTEEKTDSTPKTTFTFGIPKVAPAVTPAFAPIKIAETKTAEEDKEKPQVVPKVNFVLPNTQEAPKPVTNMFAAPLVTSQPSQGKPLTATASEIPLVANRNTTDLTQPILNSTLSVEKKDPPRIPLLSQPASATATPAAQATPTFSFGSGGGIKLSANIFSPPATAATTGISFAAPLQSAPASATPMFQKSELTTTASTMSLSAFPTSGAGSLFAKPEASTATTASPAFAAPAPAPASAPAPLFSFGTTAGIAQTQPAQPAQTDKPKFNFTFGNTNKTEAPALFKLPATIGGGLSMAGNTLGGGNGLPVGNALGGNILSGGNGLPANSMTSGTEMSHSPLSSGNGLPATNTIQAPTGGIFGAAVQKENMWSPSISNSNNVFGSSASTLPKPGGFSFGASTPFSASASASAPAPTFGSAQTTPGVFGMPQQTAPGLFGASGATAPAPAVPMFGSPSAGATPTFGTPNSSIPTFEAPSLTPATAPAFNFGGQQQASGIFGFGQQPTQPQQPQTAGGVYSFGASQPPVQFNMGSAPNAAVVQRRFRKAVRRTTPR